MPKQDFAWAVLRVLRDWKKRLTGQPGRKSLPASYTSSIFKLMRANACKRYSPGSIECAKWTQAHPMYGSAEIPNFVGQRNGPIAVTGEYVCDKCKHPLVTVDQLIYELGLTTKREKLSDRTWRRYLNSKESIPTDQFSIAVAKGFAEGWLGKWQFVSVVTAINQQSAARRSLLKVIGRAKERKSFLEQNQLDISEEDVTREIEKQLRLLDHENFQRIAQHLKAESLSMEVRQMLEDALPPKNSPSK